MIHPDAFIHPTAIIEEGVRIGAGTRVWDHAHIRRDARIGVDCIIGEKSYIAYEVVVGDRVKINSHVYLCAGVTLQDGVMVSAGTIFTNDRFPRAVTPDLEALWPSEPDERTERTLVKEGASIGVSTMIGPGLTIGRWAMVGMGAVLTAEVPDFALMMGHPARRVGWCCRCGPRLAPGPAPVCAACGRRYLLEEGRLRERED